MPESEPIIPTASHGQLPMDPASLWEEFRLKVRSLGNARSNCC